MLPCHDSERANPALCVINYNGSRYLPSTLAKVAELRKQFSQVVFVDDASTDDSVELARRLLPDARIVALTENRGPGAARNAGFERVEADRVLFMDNDVELGTDALPTLSRALDANAQAVIAMPRIVSADAPYRIEYEGGDAHFSGLLSLRAAGGDAGVVHAPPSNVGSLVSCCFLFDRARWRGGPPFDESFGMYLEDHELGVRARMLGFDLLAVPGAVGLHAQGTPGVSIRATGTHTSRRIVGTILHRWYLLLKLYQTRTLVLLSPYLLVFEVFQLAGAVALGWGHPWLSAVGKLLSSLPSVLESRAAFKGLRRRPDKAVLSGGPHPFNPALRERKAVRMTLKALDAFAAMNWAFARRLMGGSVQRVTAEW
jgi:GT2 family glycosyltransferase